MTQDFVEGDRVELVENVMTKHAKGLLGTVNAALPGGPGNTLLFVQFDGQPNTAILHGRRFRNLTRGSLSEKRTPKAFELGGKPPINTDAYKVGDCVEVACNRSVHFGKHGHVSEILPNVAVVVLLDDGTETGWIREGSLKNLMPDLARDEDDYRDADFDEDEDEDDEDNENALMAALDSIFGVPPKTAPTPNPTPKPNGQATTGAFSKADTVNPKDLYGEQKVSISKLPAVALLHGAHAMMDGAEKYGPYNWRDKEVRASIYVDAMYRHIQAWFEGEETAPDSGVHHLGHALACAAILLDAEATGNLNDDRPLIGEPDFNIATATHDRIAEAIKTKANGHAFGTSA